MEGYGATGEHATRSRAGAAGAVRPGDAGGVRVLAVPVRSAVPGRGSDGRDVPRRGGGGTRRPERSSAAARADDGVAGGGGQAQAGRSLAPPRARGTRAAPG